MTTPDSQLNLQLSRLTSVRNGEVPVILIFVKDQTPQNYKLVTPDEAQEVLALIEFMRDFSKATLEVNRKKEEGDPRDE